MNRCVRPNDPGRNTSFSFPIDLVSSAQPGVLIRCVDCSPRGKDNAPTATPGPVEWHATVGAQSPDMGRQALAFLPNEIWIHAGDSITWRWDANDIHTVTFLPATLPRPDFGVPASFTTSPATFDGSTPVISLPLVTPATFTVMFPSTGNFMLVCLVHERMTGAIHVLDKTAPLPHDQDFYDRQAADQRRDLLSDRDGRLEEACHQHGDLGGHRHSIDAHLVTVGVGEISATAGGSQTLSVVRFIDDKITIRAGQTVGWNNHDPVTPHTITFGIEPTTDVVDPSSNVTTDPDGALRATISSPADSVHSGLIVAPPQADSGYRRPRTRPWALRGSASPLLIQARSLTFARSMII